MSRRKGKVSESFAPWCAERARFLSQTERERVKHAMTCPSLVRQAWPLAGKLTLTKNALPYCLQQHSFLRKCPFPGCIWMAGRGTWRGVNRLRFCFTTRYTNGSVLDEVSISRTWRWRRSIQLSSYQKEEEIAISQFVTVVGLREFFGMTIATSLLLRNWIGVTIWLSLGQW